MRARWCNYSQQRKLAYCDDGQSTGANLGGSANVKRLLRRRPVDRHEPRRLGQRESDASDRRDRAQTADGAYKPTPAAALRGPKGVELTTVAARADRLVLHAYRR